MAEIIPYTTVWHDRLISAFVDFSTELKKHDDNVANDEKTMLRYGDEHLNKEQCFCRLVVEGETLHGFLIGYPRHNLDEVLPNFYISDMYVSPAVRSQGWGTKLLRIAEEQAKILGINEMCIGVLDNNILAAKLYEKVGYTPFIRLLRKTIT